MNATWPEIQFEWFVDRWVRPPMQRAGDAANGIDRQQSFRGRCARPRERRRAGHLGREVPPQSLGLDVSQSEDGVSGRLNVRGEPAARVAFRAKY